jgi:hypothetical protein
MSFAHLVHELTGYAIRINLPYVAASSDRHAALATDETRGPELAQGDVHHAHVLAVPTGQRPGALLVKVGFHFLPASPRRQGGRIVDDVSPGPH